MSAKADPKRNQEIRQNLFVLLDGTWNDADAVDPDSSIVRLREILNRQLKAENTKNHASKVFYDRGVGTGAFQRLGGGAFGLGLENNVRRAYRFLSENYNPGDRVFVFGFSRGAYTARSLVGLISASGLLRREYCLPNLEASVWSFYRTDPKERSSGVQLALGKFTHDKDSFGISCLAVFDTVGALGIPIRSFWRFNRELYEFHDVSLSNISQVNLQALAVDEHRLAFEASLWRSPRYTHEDSIVEQVWFAGSHGDVGGGYNAADENEYNLDDLPLDWIVRRIKFYFPSLPLCHDRSLDRLKSESSLAKQHQSRRRFYRFQGKALRTIGNKHVKLQKFRQHLVCWNRHDSPIGELLHISVIERFGHQIEIGRRKSVYRPANVEAAIPLIRDTYSGHGGHIAEPVLVVNWDGKILMPTNESNAKVVLEALDNAQSRCPPC